MALNNAAELNRASVLGQRRMIPNKRVTIAVTASAVAHDLAALGTGGTVDLRGKWIEFVAPSAVRVMRGNHAAGNSDGNTTLTTSLGFPLTTFPNEPFYVSRDADCETQITVIAGGNVTLEILYSDD